MSLTGLTLRSGEARHAGADVAVDEIRAGPAVQARLGCALVDV